MWLILTEFDISFLCTLAYTCSRIERNARVLHVQVYCYFGLILSDSSEDDLVEGVANTGESDHARFVGRQSIILSPVIIVEMLLDVARCVCSRADFTMFEFLDRCNLSKGHLKVLAWLV